MARRWLKGKEEKVNVVAASRHSPWEFLMASRGTLPSSATTSVVPPNRKGTLTPCSFSIRRHHRFSGTEHWRISPRWHEWRCSFYNGYKHSQARQCRALPSTFWNLIAREALAVSYRHTPLSKLVKHLLQYQEKVCWC